MTTPTTNSESAADREILITRTFDAPRELIWEAWTNPKHVVNWWGPRGFTTTIEEMDVRPGGVWKLVMHGPDGTDYPNKSIFTEVAKPERIVFSHGGGRKDSPGTTFIATWTFETVAENQTKVTIRMVFPTTEARDTVVKEYGAIEGGKQTLARLAELLAKEPFIIERTFNAPVAMVWKAITEPEQMKEWYFENLKTFKPEVGFETRVDVQHDGRTIPHLWKVTEVISGKKIAYRWKYVDSPGESFVSFELFAEGERTRLLLTHKGLETFDPETNSCYARRNFVRGWTQLIGVWLKEFVEEIAPFADRTFVISRTFDAPPELVWRAWTDCKYLSQWWGPHQFTNSGCQLDVRPGGAYRIIMRGPDGVEYPIEGIFKEVVPNEKLVMQMDCSGHPDAWHDLVNPNRDKTKKPFLEMLQIVTFEKAGDKTKLTIRSRFESATMLGAMVKVGMDEGWSQSLERLAGELAKM
jgi:uncharacterized protein YndB with AHSA1/START domain